jgi:NADPH:quinone reductase
MIMQIVEVTAFGGPDVMRLKTVPDPVAGPGEVVVEVAAAGVLSVETVIRKGLGGDYFPVQPPYLPGAGVTGVVTSVGPDVSGNLVGQRVAVGLEGGGYATHVVAPASALITVPGALGLREAMTLLHDANGALGLLETTPASPGETVLVQPAGGGLGQMLVQLLHARGVRVIAAARGEEKLALAKELGAELAVDYSNPQWTSQFGDLDVVFDGVGGERGKEAFAKLRDGGRFSNYGNASGSPAPVAPERGVSVRGMDQLIELRTDFRRRVTHLLAEAAAGRIRTVIGRTFPLAQAAEAHAALEARDTIGKILLLPMSG